jgi:myo-inositol-1(or 4)-monophosphatase
VEEAGGTITNYRGEPYSIYGNTLIATNGLIHQEMIEVLRKTRST